MAPDRVDDFLKRIDSIVGAPEEETPEQHAERKKMVLRDAEARRIRKAANS